MLKIQAYLIVLVVTITAATSHARGASNALGTQPTDEQPNVLLIVADDMGYGDLGSFGSKQIETPHLDELAAAGIRATSGYVCGSVCAPSRAGLLTGRYPQNFGFEHNLGGTNPNVVPNARNGIPADERLMSDYLKALGYRTGLVGKWHVGEATEAMLPNQRGFDSFMGMRHGSGTFFPQQQDFRIYRNGRELTKDDVREPYLTDWFTTEALEFIAGEGPGAETNSGEPIDADDPWFLFLSYTTPHTPLQAKDDDLERFSHIPHRGRRTYAAMQWSMDQNIGRIIDALRDSGELDNTLIVFMSDNGGAVEGSNALNAPLRGAKGTFLEGGIRVPFIFHWPAGGLSGGKVYDRPFISLDLTSTFISAAGGEMPERTGRYWNARRAEEIANKPLLDGTDLLPHLRGEDKADPHEAIFFRMTLRNLAVRKGDWKLLTSVNMLPSLFNVADDPSELTDRYQEMPELAAELQELLNAWQFGLEDTPHWLEDPYWQAVSHGRLTREYQLRQPERQEAYSGREQDVRNR